MRAIAIAALAVLVAIPASADHIALRAFPDSPICVGLPPDPFVPVSYYVIHQFSPGAIGSRWKVINSVGLVSLGRLCGGVGIPDDPANGVSVGYGSCMVGSFVACRLDYLRTDPTPITGCYHLRVEPYGADATVVVTDCASVDKSASGGYFSFEMPVIFCDDCAVAAESSTWGAVKALYR